MIRDCYMRQTNPSFIPFDADARFACGLLSAALREAKGLVAASALCRLPGLDARTSKLFEIDHRPHDIREHLLQLAEPAFEDAWNEGKRHA